MLSLKLVSGAENAEKVQIVANVPPAAERFIIGRDPKCDWPIADRLRALSARHCEIVRIEGRHVLRDTSTNGTSVNGARERLPADHLLRHGDRIHLGSYVIEVAVVLDAAAAPARAAAAGCGYARRGGDPAAMWSATTGRAAVRSEAYGADMKTGMTRISKPPPRQAGEPRRRRLQRTEPRTEPRTEAGTEPRTEPEGAPRRRAKAPGAHRRARPMCCSGWPVGWACRRRLWAPRPGRWPPSAWPSCCGFRCWPWCTRWTSRAGSWRRWAAAPCRNWPIPRRRACARRKGPRRRSRRCLPRARRPKPFCCAHSEVNKHAQRLLAAFTAAPRGSASSWRRRRWSRSVGAADDAQRLWRHYATVWTALGIGVGKSWPEAHAQAASSYLAEAYDKPQRAGKPAVESPRAAPPARAARFTADEEAPDGQRLLPVRPCGTLSVACLRLHKRRRRRRPPRAKPRRPTAAAPSSAS
ncbi:MAG: FHA domain-containing protein [Rubrivivax sp.]